MARKCKHCKTELPKVKECKDAYQRNGFCNVNCMAKHGLSKARQQKERAERKKQAEEKSRHKLRKKEVKPIKKWLDQLQALINQYVVHVRDKDKPCCTCGTNKPNIKYDAGHCFTRGARSELRFELGNIHKQCSVNCNQMHSGRQGEHKEYIAWRYGQEYLDKLEDRTQWPSLKEKYPDWQSIEKDIKKWRKILRDNGLRPNV